MMATLAGLVGAASVLSGFLATGARSDPIVSRTQAASPGMPRLPGWVLWVTVALGAALAVGPIGGLACALVVAVAPRYRDRRRARATARLLVDQLPDAVASMAAGLRAGLSLSRTVRGALAEAPRPLADSLRIVVERESLGVPLSDALRDWAATVGGTEARLLVSVLDLHRRTGGEFAVVLDRLATTLRDRAGIRREIRSLTAQARLSGTILGVLPFAFLAFLLVSSPEDMAGAFSDPVGITALTVGLTLQALAALWIRSLLRVSA